VPPDLETLAVLSTWVKNNDVTHAEVVAQLAATMTKQGHPEATGLWIAQITNYRKALAELTVWETVARQGEFQRARKGLLQNSQLPSLGVGLQESEIIVRMTTLADALGALPDLLKQWEKEKRTLPAYLAANLKTGYTQAGLEPMPPPMEPQKHEAGSFSAPTSPGLVQQRMVRRGTSEGLAIRAAGLIAQGKKDLAVQLLLPFFGPNGKLPAANLGQTAELLDLAFQAGLEKEVLQRVPDLVADSDALPSALTTGPGYRSRVIALLGQLGQEEQARPLAEKYRQQALADLEPYFATLGLADLAEGCWRGDLPDLALRFWSESLEASLKNRNPRSQAVGVFQVWRGMISAGAPIPEEVRQKTSAWLGTIADEYAQLGID